MKTFVVIVRIVFADAPAALSDVEPGGGECTLQRSAEPGLVDTTMEGQVTFTRIVAISANQHASISCCDRWLLIAHVRPPRGLRRLIPICQTVYRSWEVVNFCFVTCAKQCSFKISRIKHSGTCFYHYVFISNRIKWLWWSFFGFKKVLQKKLNKGHRIIKINTNLILFVLLPNIWLPP